ncbi:MAG: hypothetical protein HY913_15765 [Desulfomonile tiedjei]|nr:hypothetical protein [Desulfomonile tiedjei]
MPRTDVTAGYGEYVRILCEAYVFPQELSYQGVGIHRDNVVVERVERDGQSWWITCRARYSGTIMGIGVADRARVHYDNGGIRVDLGGLHGVIDTGAALSWFNDLIAQMNDGRKRSIAPTSGRNYIEVYLENQAGPSGNSAQRWIMVSTDLPDVVLFQNYKLRNEGHDSVLDYRHGPNGREVLSLEGRDGQNGNSGQRWILRPTDENGIFLMQNYRLTRHENRDFVIDYCDGDDGKFICHMEQRQGTYGNSAQRWYVTKIEEPALYLIKSFRRKRDNNEDLVLDWRR